MSSVLQIVNGFCQLSQSKWLNSVFSALEVDDCALGNCGLARKTCGRKLLCLRPDLVQIFRVDESFVFAARLVCRVHHSRVIENGDRRDVPFFKSLTCTKP